MEERRRAERIPVQIPARLLLSRKREVACTIRNVGELGVLLSIADLETEVHEGERALLEHPRIVDGRAQKAVVRTPGAVVRVELDMEKSGVLRHVALYFDGGPSPEGAA